ncbi:PREDICTED: E3 ubiquitin-protein ligase MYCBP2-like, partial [Amphimedon queenslandica]|uniref:Uncharacterized protein n=1 Tax=Amphimedon queenslandica TaxID=400682 RepID=A0AAN0IR04_AMPQE
MKIVVDESPAAASKLSAVASSCLVSLVVALGQTSKILSAIAALLIGPNDYNGHYLKVPDILRSLQVSVKAVLIGSPYDTDWFDQGIQTKSLVDKWPLPGLDHKPPSSSLVGSIATDSKYLYVHGSFGLMKIGSGYGNTIKGRLSESVSEFHNDEAGRLLFASGKLYFAPIGKSLVIMIDPDTLKVQETMELDVDAVGPHCLFTDGTDLKQIAAKKEGGFSLRKLTTICSPIPIVEERPLQLSQKSIIVLGRAKYDNQGSLHTLYQNNLQEVSKLSAARNTIMISTTTGKLYYQGSGVVVGVTGKDTPKGQWTEVELPDAKMKIESIAVDNTGSFCVLVTDKGVVYFGGVNRKGEAGENAPVGRQQPKPVKLKKFSKLKDQEITSCACGPHTTAFIGKDGKLFMFGALEDDLVDKTTGVVTSMLGVPASQIALGRSHTIILTQLGTIYSFGSNQYGQCGRNYIPPSEDQGIEEGDEELDVISEDDDEHICPKGEHTWTNERCLICQFCKYCTGYGPSCCNEGMPDRDPG